MCLTTGGSISRLPQSRQEKKNQSFEATNELLPRNEKDLEKVVKNADAKLVQLKKAKKLFEGHLKSAKIRLEKVTTIADRLCQECFNLLPALGMSLEDDDAALSCNAPNCAVCGMTVSWGSLRGFQLDMPPSAGTCGAAAEGAITFGGDMPTTNHPSSHHHPDAPQPQALNDKREYLGAAGASVTFAKLECTRIENAISQWTIFRNRNKHLLDENFKSAAGPCAQQQLFPKKSLEEKLESLGGGNSGSYLHGTAQGDACFWMGTLDVLLLDLDT